MHLLITLNSAKPTCRLICASQVAKKFPPMLPHTSNSTGVHSVKVVAISTLSASKSISVLPQKFSKPKITISRMATNWNGFTKKPKSKALPLTRIAHSTSVPSVNIGVLQAHTATTSTTSRSLTKKDGVSGIDDITVNEENAPVEYYNLQGVRVENPENGIFIRRQGNSVTKCVK